jgi:RNA polymerase sigma factor (sigma-70 family)
MGHESDAVTRLDPTRERALVARARVDVSAFGELYDFYLPRIHGYVLRRLGDRAAAEDVTAMTFERALSAVRRDDFRNDSFGGWLYRVAGNATVDHVRRSRRMAPMGRRATDAAGPLEPERDRLRARGDRLPRPYPSRSWTGRVRSRELLQKRHRRSSRPN